MIPASKMAKEGERFHGVRFYESQESLCQIVAEFLGEGLAARQPALIIGTPEHCQGILRELTNRHFDIEKMTATGDLLVLDAKEMLSAFMVEDMPNADRFHATAVQALEQLRRGRTSCAIRAYGEMVDVLWRQNQRVAAIAVEMLWNKLAMTHEFSLLCGYAVGNFYKDVSVSMSDICNQHSHVVGSNGLVSRTSVKSDRVN